MAMSKPPVVLLAVLLATLATSRPVAAQGFVPANVTREWNTLLVQLSCKHGLLFSDSAYYFSVMNLASWHALLALRNAGSSVTSQEAVVAFACHYVMTSYFRIEQNFLLEATLKSQLNRMSLTAAQRNLAKALAHAVASDLVASRQNEGAQYALDSYKYPTIAEAGLGEFSWNVPPQDYFLPFPYPLLGQLPMQRTYVMPAPETFRTNTLRELSPPRVPSPEWDQEYNISFTLGKNDSTARTPEQTIAGLFWAGLTKGGACNQVTPWIGGAVNAIPATTPLYDAVVMLAQLSVSQHDGSTLFVHLQNTFRFWRPAQAFRRGDPEHPPVPDWTPLGLTPSHPEYPSGTALLAGAARCILEAYLPRPGQVVLGGGSPAGVVEVGPRNYTSWKAAAQDAADGRVFVGAHFRKSVQDGLTAGCKLAKYVMANWGLPVPSGVLPKASFLTFYSDEVEAAGNVSAPGYILPASAASFEEPLPDLKW